MAVFCGAPYLRALCDSSLPENVHFTKPTRRGTRAAGAGRRQIASTGQRPLRSIIGAFKTALGGNLAESVLQSLLSGLPVLVMHFVVTMIMLVIGIHHCDHRGRRGHHSFDRRRSQSAPPNPLDHADMRIAQG